MTRQVNDIQITEETPANRRISWWFENTLRRVVKRVLNDSKTFIENLIARTFQTTVEDLENEFIPFVRPFANQILSMDGIPDNIKNPIRDALLGDSPAGLVILGVCLLAIGETLKMGFSGPLGRKMEAQVDYVFRSALFSPELIIEMWKREIITGADATEYLRYNGLTDASIVAIKEMSIPLTDDNTLTQLYWRKTKSQSEIRAELRKRGMTSQQVTDWETVRQVIPSPGELVAIAVREGFNDNIARTFGYDENYPVEAAEWAEKGGMQQTFFKAMWRAHWNLPGLVQVREMFHRGIVNESELDVYLLAADYPSYWREAIKQWMYSIVTRVDARRLYDLGVWDLARVYQHNLELGYNASDAMSMTQWIAMSYAEEERELTKTDILNMYKDGILNNNEADSLLSSLDFNDASISLMLAHQDLKRDEEYERAIINNIKALFLAGIYDRTDVLAKMGQLNTPPDVIRQSIAVWDLDKERKIVRPTVAQLRDMAQEEIITIEQWRIEMGNRRYSDKYINWYQELWLKE